MEDVFLSASVPQPTDVPYSETADPLLIHSAVKSLCALTFGHKRIVWGGHPAITPMMWAACENLGVEYAKTVHLYQSKFFPVEMYPEENAKFSNVTYVDADGDMDSSLRKMRKAMMECHRYEAGVFIGGKAGIEVEYSMFVEAHPKAAAVILPSTGGAAAILGAKYPNHSAPSADFIDFIGYLGRFISVEVNGQ